MTIVDRIDVFARALEIYEKQFADKPLPSNILVYAAIEKIVQQCTDRASTIAFLETVRERRALFVSMGEESPINPETFQIIDCVIEAYKNALTALN